MSLLPSAVSLHDVKDVDAFVSTVVRKLGPTLFAEERAELEAEGFRILYEMAEAWDGRGTFAGFASAFLGKRILSAWHKLEGHSRKRTFNLDGTWDGGRAWVTPPVVSLNAELERPGFDERRLTRV